MKKTGVSSSLLLLGLLPTQAYAAGSGTSLALDFVKMLAMLALVLGGMFLLQAVVQRVRSKRDSQQRPGRHLRIVEAKYMGPKRSLMILEVGGEHLLLADTPEGITFLKEVYPQPLDLDASVPAPLDSLTGVIKGVFNSRPSSTETCPVCKKRGLDTVADDKYRCGHCNLEFEKVANHG